MPRKFYAIKYAYGRNVVNNGTRADHVYQFDTLAERDRFVADEDGNDAEVDAVSARHSDVRKALRAAALGLEWPQAV